MQNIIFTISKYALFIALTYLLYLSMYHSNDNYMSDVSTLVSNEVTHLSSSDMTQLVSPPQVVDSVNEKLKTIVAPKVTITPKTIITPKAIIPESIWSGIRQEFKLERNVTSKEVQKEIQSLVADSSRLYRILQSASPYLYYIVTQTKKYNLPAELALIPVIESEFNPYDKSHKGALGLWQLMSVTAHELGVNIKHDYDGRRNVIMSTEAALTYFKDLGLLFHGNWYLAIAAYNSGQHMVQGATKRAGHKDFWNLKLPRETKTYVPKLLALAEIIKYPEKYHVKLPHISNTPYFAKLETKKNINLTRFAKLTGVDLDILTKLNPDYTRGSNPYSNKNKFFLIPIENEKIAKYYLTA